MTEESEANEAAGFSSMPPTAAAPGSGVAGHACPECSQRMAAPPPDLYAIGRLEARFPSIGLEREFQHRLAVLPADERSGTKKATLRRVLQANPYLAVRMCYVLMVAGYPAFIVSLAGAYLRETLFSAIGDDDQWCTIIGKVGPMASPGTCQGLLAPIAMADQIYSFSMENWLTSLRRRLEKPLERHKMKPEMFDGIAGELFERIVHSTENLGATDAHRALNYALMQHPGIFLAAAERSGRSVLDRIETRLIRGLGPRRLVAIVLTFLDSASGVPERLFCRVDVTEEWPFVAGDAGTSHSPLGLTPFVETEVFGLSF